MAVIPTQLGRRHLPAFKKVLLRHPVSRIGPWYLVDYRKSGTEFRAWKMSPKAYPSRLSAYLKGPHRQYVLVRDLETWLRLAPDSEDERDERKQVWDHVKDLRRRMASLN